MTQFLTVFAFLFQSVTSRVTQFGETRCSGHGGVVFSPVSACLSSFFPSHRPWSKMRVEAREAPFPPRAEERPLGRASVLWISGAFPERRGIAMIVADPRRPHGPGRGIPGGRMARRSVSARRRKDGPRRCEALAKALEGVGRTNATSRAASRTFRGRSESQPSCTGRPVGQGCHARGHRRSAPWQATGISDADPIPPTTTAPACVESRRHFQGSG